MYIGSENQKINPNRIKFSFFFLCFWASWDQFQAVLVCSVFILFCGRLWIRFWGTLMSGLLLQKFHSAVSFQRVYIYFVSCLALE